MVQACRYFRASDIEREYSSIGTKAAGVVKKVYILQWIAERRRVAYRRVRRTIDSETRNECCDILSLLRFGSKTDAKAGFHRRAWRDSGMVRDGARSAGQPRSAGRRADGVGRK